MTVAEKIKVFNSISDILQEIENDRQAIGILNRRYAVRFIMLDNFDVYREFVKQLIPIGIKSFDIENLLIDDKDRWITQDELKNEIKSISESSIISPFSEIARFYDDMRFKAFFNEISLLEYLDNPSLRIYIPLIGLQNRFEDFLNSFARIAESAPVWSIRSDEPQKVNLFLVNNNHFSENYQGLKTLYDWLRFWKTQAPVEKIVCSSLPVIVNAKNSQPDNIFTPIPVDSTHDFIKKYHNLSLNIPYIEKEEKYWLQLLPHILDNSFNFNQFSKKYFNVIEFSVKDILNRWTDENTTVFERWLLKHYYLQVLFTENQYLTNAFNDCVNYSSLELFRKIALLIFGETNNLKFIEERTTLLCLFDKQYQLPDSDLSEMKDLILNIAKSDTEKAISLCSSKFDFEKEMFIGWYKVGKLNNRELQKLYPDFFAYQSDIKYNSWANSYIQSYKQAKIENKYTEEIKNFISEKNANEDTFYNWYHSDFESSKELLAKEKSVKTYWIDGLGIEYLSLIQEVINNSSFYIKSLQIAKTDIPSSTEHNRFDNVEKIDDLDRFIHDNIYQYPQTICKEIDIVKNIFKKIINHTTEATIAIVSDHGLTALSRLVDSKKYATKASHLRYIDLGNDEAIEDTDYIRHKNGEHNFKVALTHASLNEKPRWEVHGGCTPEEILVPFIVISNKKDIIKSIQTNTINQNTPLETTPKQMKGFEEEDLF